MGTPLFRRVICESVGRLDAFFMVPFQSWILRLCLAAAIAGGAIVATHQAALAGGQPPASRVITFNKDIAPIFAAHCWSCHRPGGVGHFSLATYTDARPRARSIGLVTARRAMPPWKPEQRSGEFLGQRVLGDEQIRTIQDWVAAGALEGEAGEPLPLPRGTDGWELGTPDLIVGMSEAYVLRPGGADVFRTFVIPIPIVAPRYVRAVEFRPGNARAVHHANLGIDRTGSSRRLDLRDPEPGYAGGMVAEARNPEGHMLGWTPGRNPQPSPEGMPWRLDPGSDLVVQLHMPPTLQREAVQVSVGLFFTPNPPVRVPAGIRLGKRTLAIPPGERQYVVSDTYVLPVDVEVLAVQPHAHFLARQVRAVATTPDSKTVPLISIDDWDFMWQDIYRYARPLFLPKGTALSVRFTYDNSAGNPRNPNRPPRRVSWGPNVSDEMDDLWIQVAPRSPAEVAVLNGDFRRKAHNEDLAAAVQLLNADPANPLRHDAVATLFLDEGRVIEAIRHFERSLDLNPDSAPTRYNLGTALSAIGRLEEAIEQFRAVLRDDPGFADAQINLGAALHSLGDLDAARIHYRRAIALRPDSAEAHNNLGRLLLVEGEAAAALREVQRALELRPDWPPALSNLAWIRATAGDGAVRAPDEAVRLAVRAGRLTGDRDASTWDVLGAAYAAAGQFALAISAARRAERLAADAQMVALVREIRKRLALYERRLPFVETRFEGSVQ